MDGSDLGHFGNWRLYRLKEQEEWGKQMHSCPAYILYSPTLEVRRRATLAT